MLASSQMGRNGWPIVREKGHSMISGILNGIAAGSTTVDLGNATLNFVAGLPSRLFGVLGQFFTTFGS